MSKHKSLVDEFVYPNGGTGAFYEKCADFVRANEGTIHLNTAVKKELINKVDKTAKGIALANGTTVEPDHMISIIPLTQFIKGFDGDSSGRKHH
jgi:protoporphyrinogen oxidase